MKIAPLVVLMSLAALSAGCFEEKEGSTTSARASSEFDACSLLTTAEVEAELHGTVQKIEKDGSPTGTKICHWFGPAPQGSLSKGITIMVALDNGAARYDGFRKYAPNPTEEGGFGDAAYSTPDGVLALYRGNVFMRISPLNSASGHTVEISKRLTTKALQRLP